MQRRQLPLSSLQAKVDLDSLEAKEKLASVAVVLAAGAWVIDVSGAVVSRGVLVRKLPACDSA